MQKIFLTVMLSLIVTTVFMPDSAIADVAANPNAPIGVKIDGVGVAFPDARPIIKNARTIVPVRAVTEAMGAEVFWNADEKEVTIRKACKKMDYEGQTYENSEAVATLKIGQSIIKISLFDKTGTEVFEKIKEMDVAAEIIEGRTFIPCRYVGYALGYDIDWNGMIPMVTYTSLGYQRLDFVVLKTNSEYPETFTDMRGDNYPARKGYQDILIVDVSKGRLNGIRFENLPSFKFTPDNVLIETNEEKYSISNEKTKEENLETFKLLYKEKAVDDVEGNTLKYNTTESSIIGLSSRHSISAYDDYKVLPEGKTFYTVNCRKPSFDMSMFWADRRKLDPDTIYGDKMYGYKADGILYSGSDKTTLLFLNEFLGETGQRIWYMMRDYNNHTNFQYVAPETEWPYYGTYSDGTCRLLQYHEISKETVEKYGLTFDHSYCDEFTGNSLLVLEENGQKIYIEYCKQTFDESIHWFSSYKVSFEYVDN